MGLHHSGQTRSYLQVCGLVAKGLIQCQQDGASKLHRLARLAITGAMKMTPETRNTFRMALQCKVSASLQHLLTGLTS
jgi:hypothetical protein